LSNLSGLIAIFPHLFPVAPCNVLALLYVRI
jgi:hypothetical protein